MQVFRTATLPSALAAGASFAIVRHAQNDLNERHSGRGNMAENKAQDSWGEEMDAKAHLGTYDAFIAMSKWGTVGVIVVLVLMAIFLL
jgi:hypothetical protein